MLMSGSFLLLSATPFFCSAQLLEELVGWRSKTAGLRGVARIGENPWALKRLGYGAPTLNSFLWGFEKGVRFGPPLCQEDVLPHQLGEWRSQNPSPPCCQQGPGVDKMARVQAAGLVQMQLSALSRYRPKGVQIHCPNAQKPLFGRKMDHLMDSVERSPSVIII